MPLPFFAAISDFLATASGLTLGKVSKVLLVPFSIFATGKNSVSIGPGHTAVTLIFLLFNSNLNALEKEVTYALVELYTAIRALGTNDAIELTFII